jgi:hypothetical protein
VRNNDNTLKRRIKRETIRRWLADKLLPVENRLQKIREVIKILEARDTSDNYASKTHNGRTTTRGATLTIKENNSMKDMPVIVDPDMPSDRQLTSLREGITHIIDAYENGKSEVRKKYEQKGTR